MAPQLSNERTAPAPGAYDIDFHAGYFTVKFTSPYNSIHQVSGLKTENEVKAWVAEATLLTKTYP